MTTDGEMMVGKTHSTGAQSSRACVGVCVFAKKVLNINYEYDNRPTTGRVNQIDAVRARV